MPKNEVKCDLNANDGCKNVSTSRVTLFGQDERPQLVLNVCCECLLEMKNLALQAGGSLNVKSLKCGMNTLKIA